MAQVSPLTQAWSPSAVQYRTMQPGWQRLTSQLLLLWRSK